MDKSYYKVSYIEKKDIDSEPISLVFQKIQKSPPESVIEELIRSIENLNSENTDINIIRNLKNVLELGEDFSLSKFSEFLVILYEFKGTEEKEGLLFANEKGRGKALIGYWPFYSEEDLSTENLERKCEKLVNDKNQFKRVLITR